MKLALDVFSEKGKKCSFLFWKWCFLIEECVSGLDYFCYEKGILSLKDLFFCETANQQTKIMSSFPVFLSAFSVCTDELHELAIHRNNMVLTIIFFL